MGTLSSNERIKLRATRYNNISTGLFLAGVLLPYLDIVRNWQVDYQPILHSWAVGQVTFDELVGNPLLRRAAYANRACR